MSFLALRTVLIDASKVGITDLLTCKEKINSNDLYIPAGAHLIELFCVIAKSSLNKPNVIFKTNKYLINTKN